MRTKLQRAVQVLPLLAVVACAHHAGRAVARPSIPVSDWRTVSTSADRLRLRAWRGVWFSALAQVAAAGRKSVADAEGPLLLPDSGIDGPSPPPGDYRCRSVKLGAKRPGLPAFTASPVFACRVAEEGGIMSLAKLAGAQRPVGLLFPDDGRRLVFLGTMMLADERMAQQYGRDPDRDMVGFVERIGAQRWRLVLPSPRWESLIDVVELVPVIAS